MTEFEQYKKGYSPPALQRKYGLTYVQGYELAQDFKRLQEQIDDLMGCLMAIRDRGCEKDFDCILSADITLQKWGVK